VSNRDCGGGGTVKENSDEHLTNCRVARKKKKQFARNPSRLKGVDKRGKNAGSTEEAWKKKVEGKLIGRSLIKNGRGNERRVSLSQKVGAKSNEEREEGCF